MAHRILRCATCLRHTAHIPIAPRASLSITRAAIPLGRRYATTASEAESTSDRIASTDAPQKFEAKELTPEEDANRKRERLNTSVQKQLKYLPEDPWKVQEYVEKALKRDAFEEACAIVQKMSTKDLQIVVAWNHIIDHCLQNQRMKQAFKLFNDMKKRAQLPNVRTYTIIFRGLMVSRHPKTAVAECLKYYNYLLNDSRLEPNTHHLNAALTVCAKAGDLDAMFVIADSINESTRAADASTYTVILNGLRHKALEELKARVAGDKGADAAAWTEEQREEHIATLIGKARGLWAEVVDKWESGKLVVDESLVCAMGRLLLMSPRKEEKREVFDLLQQTMKIPNLIKNPELGGEKDEAMKGIAKKTQTREPTRNGKPSLHAIPGNNTLSLILTNLAYTREVTAGIKYWNLLVRHYGIVPDSDIWVRMFKLLRAVKASAHAASMIEIMPKDRELNHEPTFRTAMETCIRDNLNPNVVKNSNRILDAMLERLEQPDPHTMRLYIRVALVSHQQFRDIAGQEGEGKAEEGKRLYGEQILKALGALWEPYKQAYYHFWNQAERVRSPANIARNENGKAEVIALARAMVSAFDKLTNENMLSEAQVAEIKPVAAKIHREIRAHFANTTVTDPAVKRKADRKPTNETISKKEEAQYEKDASEESFALAVGPEWAWDTYKPVVKKSRREQSQEKMAAIIAKKANDKQQLKFYKMRAREERLQREQIEKEREEDREREEYDKNESRYPWERGFQKPPYEPMEMRRKRPSWSPDAPYAKTGPNDKRFKANQFDPRREHDESYHRRPEVLGGEQTPRIKATTFYGDARRVTSKNAERVVKHNPFADRVNLLPKGPERRPSQRQQGRRSRGGEQMRNRHEEDGSEGR